MTETLTPDPAESQCFALEHSEPRLGVASLDEIIVRAIRKVQTPEGRQEAVAERLCRATDCWMTLSLMAELVNAKATGNLRYKNAVMDRLPLDCILPEVEL